MISNPKRHQRSFLKDTNHNYLVILFIFLMILSCKSVSKCKILTIISKFLHFFVLSFLWHTDPIRRLFTNRTKSDQSEPCFVLLPRRGLLLLPNSRVIRLQSVTGLRHTVVVTVPWLMSANVNVMKDTNGRENVVTVSLYLYQRRDS